MLPTLILANETITVTYEINLVFDFVVDNAESDNAAVDVYPDNGEFTTLRVNCPDTSLGYRDPISIMVQPRKLDSLPVEMPSSTLVRTT